MEKTNVKTLFEASEISNRVRELGAEIQREIEGTDPLVICVLGGSMPFASDLLRSIATPLRYEFVHVDFEPTAGGQPQGIHYPIPIDVRGEDVLVVKDVVGSGVIESYLAAQFAERGAATIRFAALIDLPKERTTHCHVDYKVFTTERPGRLVGYGMKSGGRFGTLPFIGAVVEGATEES